MSRLRVETPPEILRLVDEFKWIVKTRNPETIYDWIDQRGPRNPSEDEECGCLAEHLVYPAGLWIHQNHLSYNKLLHPIIEKMPKKVLAEVRKLAIKKTRAGDKKAQLLMRNFLTRRKPVWAPL